MIKQSLTILSLVAAATAMANAAVPSTILVKFGEQTGTDASLTVNNNTWNYLNGSAGKTWNSLKFSDGSTSSFFLTTAAGMCEPEGRMNSFDNAGDTSKIVSEFDLGSGTGEGISWLTSYGGVYNKRVPAENFLKIGGLELGQQYSLTLLLGRGNQPQNFNENNTYSFIHGAEDVLISLVASNTSSNGTISNNTLFGSTNGTSDPSGGKAENWMLATFSFTASDSTIVFNDSTGAGNISALKLSKIPEPSLFGLLAGLGALALAGTRRRRRK